MNRGKSGTGAGVRGSWLRGMVAGMLAAVLLLGSWTGAFAADGQTQPAPAGPTRAQLDQALASLQASLGKAEPVSDWVALGLARSGKPAAARYLPQAEKSVKDGNLRLVTDYARTALAVNANGGNVRQFGAGKIDLLAKIANFDKMTAQGPNAPAYALLALDAGGYTPGLKDRWSRDSLLKWLVDHRNADGGWSLAPGKSDVDVTGIVLTALAAYQDREDVRTVTEAALVWLSGRQLENGGFGAPETSESTVQVLIALTSLGLDAGNDSRFVKNGNSALARLMAFRLDSGSFAHVPGGKADGLASLYAFLGLTAVGRWQDGVPALYAGVRVGQAVEVTVDGTGSQLANETVNGRTAMEALIETLHKKDISYAVTRHPQYGAYPTKISFYQNGDFGGYDGWQYAVQRNGEWLTGLPGMPSFIPQGGDRIVVYYGDYNTPLIHSVKAEPANPREGQPVTVTVEKEVSDWETGKVAVSPAESARVTVGGQTVTTDKDGKATLQSIVKGHYTLIVDAYREGGVPAYVAYSKSFDVASYVKTVAIRVEGDKGSVAAGTAQGGTALEAVESFLKAKNITYEIKDTSFGKYLTSIGGTAAGKYGGYDGWQFAVKNGGGSWTVPDVGMGSYLLEDGEEVVFFYGGVDIKRPEPVVVTPEAPKPGDTVTVSVTYREMDWDALALGSPKPLAGVRVSAGAVSAVTDANGHAKLAGLKEGAYALVVSGYAEGKAPSVVRTATPLAVVGSYSDQGKVSGWAVDSVRVAGAAGVLRGLNDKSGTFGPQTAVTRAEFVSALVRALGLKPLTGSDFKDVSAKAWYAQDIQAAAKAGLIAGVAPGKFAPGDKLTREQAAQLLARALKIKPNGILSITDSAKVFAGAVPAVQAVLEQGWMTVFNGYFSPKQTMPREQAAVIAVRLLFRPGIGKLGK